MSSREAPPPRRNLTVRETALITSPRFAGRLGRGLVRIAAVTLLVGLVAACGDDKDKLALDDTPPDAMYNKGLAYVKIGNLGEAARTFERLDQTYPYSEYARKAMVMTAYVQYARGDYLEAINSARRFLTLFPGSPDAAYALYIIGQSYYAQVPEVGRDQSQAAQAIAAFQEVLNRYPDSEYANDSRAKILALQNQLAGKEMEIGRFYLQQRNYIAAINRFRVVVENYQQTNHIEEALSRLVECYYALGITSEAQTAAAVLGHNFPDSEWYKASYELLKTGGYSPQENTSSWISKAFLNFRLF